MADLSIAEARRLVLGAQGFGGPRTKGTRAQVSKLARRLHAYQIDSVNVLVRAHYMPAFSRLGPYPMESIEHLAYTKRDLFEFWAHAACYIPIELYPLFRFRMEGMASADWYAGASKQVRTYIETVYNHVAEHGPVLASEVPQAGKSTGNWWGWSNGKRAIETLFRIGRVAVAGRRNFARLYDIRERVIPKEHLDAPAPDPEESRKRLLVLATKAHGVGTAKDIAGYFHIAGWYDRSAVDGKRPKNALKRLMGELVEEGSLEQINVEGWAEAAYIVPGTKVPRPIHARALCSPFDPLLWNRYPTSRVFGFDYQIEIYVPEPKRIYGYYCLPFLLGDHFVGRVDLKADRKAKTLLVQGAFPEAGVDKKHVAAELAEELRLMAKWLELDMIAVVPKGDLARPLKKALT